MKYEIIKNCKSSCKFLITVLGATLLIIGFQNCQSNAVLGIKGVQPSLKPADSPSTTITQDMEQMPADVQCSDCSSSQQTQTSNPNRGNQTMSNDQDDQDSKYEDSGSCKKYVYGEGDQSIRDDYFVALCNRANDNKDKLVMVDDGGSISGLRGSHALKLDSIKSITDKRGKLIVLGLKDNSSIDEVSNLRGTQVFCGVHIKKMSDVRGNTIIVNGSVDNMDSSVLGNIRIIKK